jgi:hypothetical protein
MIDFEKVYVYLFLYLFFVIGITSHDLAVLGRIFFSIISSLVMVWVYINIGIKKNKEE